MRTTMYFDDEVYEELRREAYLRTQTVSSIVRRAVDDWLDKNRTK